jgi:hypothetical protein
MQVGDPPQLPLTPLRTALVGAGALLFVAQVVAAVLLAPPMTGAGDADALLLFALWLASLASAVVTVLLLVRQADIPDVATASMLVSIATFAAFTLSAAIDARGTDAEQNLTDALFLGVTAGALDGVLVWGIAIGVARLLRLPRTRLPEA